VETKEPEGKSEGETATPWLSRLRISLVGGEARAVGPMVRRRAVAGSGAASRACGRRSPEPDLALGSLNLEARTRAD
jgi:hypothetical protein